MRITSDAAAQVEEAPLSLRLPAGGTPQADWRRGRSWEPVSYVNDVEAEGARFEFRNSLKVELAAVEGGFEVFAPALGLAGFGEDARLAMADLAATAVALWREFSASTEAELHASAVVSRERLRQYFAPGT